MTAVVSRLTPTACRGVPVARALGHAGTAVLAAAPILFAALSALAGEARQARPHRLRVVTYNVRHGQTNAPCAQPSPGPGRLPEADCGLDLSAAVAVLRRIEADVVALQEVDRYWARSASRDQAAEISAGVGMRHRCYAPNLDHDADEHASVPHQYGTLVLSRFPFLDCRNTLLGRTGDNEQRGLTLALVDVRGLRVQVYNTHLHTTAGDRRLQAREVAEAMDAAPPGPKVLMGDFNALPGDAEMAVSSRLRDVWREAPMPTPGNPEGLTAPARLDGPPLRRIDYVFVSPEVGVSRALVPIDEETRRASDHYPLVADLALPDAPLKGGP